MDKSEKPEQKLPEPPAASPLTVRVRMLMNTPVSFDGISKVMLYAGTEYDLSRDLAGLLLNTYCELVEEKKDPGPQANKMEGKPKENK